MMDSEMKDTDPRIQVQRDIGPAKDFKIPGIKWAVIKWLDSIQVFEIGVN